VAKFDEKGDLRWITQGRRRQERQRLHDGLRSAWHLFLGGSFGGTAKFDEATITSAGGNDLYVAKLKAK